MNWVLLSYFSLLLSSAQNLKIENMSSYYYLLPFAKNTITPFDIILESDEDDKKEIKLMIECSEESRDLFMFQSETIDFCNQMFNQSIVDTQKFLKQLEVKIKPFKDQISNLYLNYSLYYSNNKNSDEEETIDFKQNFTIPSEIPLTTLDMIIKHDTKMDKDFRNDVLQINDNYLKNSSMANLEVVKYDENFPDWIHFHFTNNTLQFWGTIDSVTENKNVVFYIRDNLTKLNSKMLTIWITGNNLPGKNSKNMLLLILIMFLFVVVVLGILLVLKRQKTNLKRSIDANMKRQEAYSLPKTVLSDSIINWNRKLVLKHRHSVNFSNDQIDTIVVEDKGSVQNKYMRFDDSTYLSQQQSNSKPDFEMKEKLSDIHPSDQHTQNECSGFIDENIFKKIN